MLLSQLGFWDTVGTYSALEIDRMWSASSDSSRNIRTVISSFKCVTHIFGKKYNTKKNPTPNNPQPQNPLGVDPEVDWALFLVRGTPPPPSFFSLSGEWVLGFTLQGLTREFPRKPSIHCYEIKFINMRLNLDAPSIPLLFNDWASIVIMCALPLMDWFPIHAQILGSWA